MTNHPNRKKIKLTPQQRAYVDALLDSSSHLCLRARAGTGKTSTIIEGVDAYAAKYPEHEILVCAYNKAITDEVAAKLLERGHGEWKDGPDGKRVPPRVRASTAHSLGLSTFKWLFKPEIDDKKVRKIVDAMIEETNSVDVASLYRQYGHQIVSLVGVAKQAGVGFFSDLAIGDVGTWHALADHFDINGLDDTADADAVVAAAQRVYRASLEQTDVVDFDDMILFPLVKNIRVKFTKDLVIVDEAQDLSRARQALLRKFLGPRGRMVVVGDDRQAIYGFSGADAAALENLIDQLGAEVLPLSTTWRCPKKVVELAQTIVPDIEAAPTAADGEVLRIPATREYRDELAMCEQLGLDKAITIIPWYADLERSLGPEDAVLCRNTAPLVSLAYQLIRAKIPCKVEGRAIGEGLKALASRWKVTTTAALRKRLDAYAERERQKALAKGNESKAEEVTDRVATLLEICGVCEEAGGKQVSDVVAFIDDLFADGAEGVTVLATYHRSKGREWPRVFLLEHAARCPSRAARQEWARRQEENLAYVAFTRAQHTLVFVG